MARRLGSRLAVWIPAHLVAQYFENGWPVPFGEYSLHYRKHNYLQDSFHLTSVKAAVCDVLLAAVLVAATGVAVFRLARRVRTSLQYTVADMLALTASVAMVLGLLCLDRLPKMAIVWNIYTPLHNLTQFDRAMVLFSVGCAVALTVSTACARLGSAASGRASAAADSDPPAEEKRP